MVSDEQLESREEGGSSFCQPRRYISCGIAVITTRRIAGFVVVTLENAHIRKR